MSKDEFLKIQTCTLKVTIHCDGCKRKVKKILQNIEGVYTVGINSEHGTVTVSGNVDPSMFIKSLAKRGKLAHILVAPKQNHHINDLIKNIQIKSDGKIKNQGPQQLKGFQDLKLASKLVDIKLPSVGVGGKDGHKSVKFKVSESGDDDSDDEEEEDEYGDDYDEDELNDDDDADNNNGDGDGDSDTDGDDDDEFDDDEFDDDDVDEFDDDMDDIPVKKPTMASGGMDLIGHISSIKGSESMTGTCNYQQRLKGATTNQQQEGSSNESFQPLTYAQLPPSSSYIEPPYPPYSYLQAPHGEPLTPYSSDENNTSSCNVM